MPPQPLLPIHYPDPDNDDHQSGLHPCFEADAIRDVLQSYPLTDLDRSCPKKPGDKRFSFRQKWLAWMVCYRDDSNQRGCSCKAFQAALRTMQRSETIGNSMTWSSRTVAEINSVIQVVRNLGDERKID